MSWRSIVVFGQVSCPVRVGAVWVRGGMPDGVGSVGSVIFVRVVPGVGPVWPRMCCWRSRAWCVGPMASR